METTTQRRIRSAENANRIVSREGGEGPENGNPTDDDEDDALVLSCPNLDEMLQDMRQLKRPLSRKKDPSASAAAGLGVVAGPGKMTDAFEMKKIRKPIPMESWGPRPPSRAGQKAVPLNVSPDMLEPLLMLVQTRSCSSIGQVPKGSQLRSSSSTGPSAGKVVGGTWAAARKSRGSSESRNRKISRNLSVFDHHAQLGSRGSSWHAQWGGHENLIPGLEVNGCGLGDPSGNSWPGSPTDSCGSPPTRQRMRHFDGDSVEEPGHLEDSDFKSEFKSRSGQAGKSKGHSNSRREQRNGGTREREQNKPFQTSLDVDFLSLFAT